MSALNCPNTNSQEWKMLSKQTGEKLANLAFIANGYQIPNVRPITEIKKAIGFKSKVESYTSMAKKLRIYNAKNGTSHSFTKVELYGNTFQLEFFPNYLTVNQEKQRRRSESRGEVFRVESFHNEAFDTVYTPSFSEQQTGFFDENGDFKPLSDKIDNIDYMMPDNQVTYKLKSTKILSSEKAKQVFAKGKKNNWDLNKILTELQISKDQKQLILDKGLTTREEIVTSLLAENTFVVEVNTAKEHEGKGEHNLTPHNFYHNYNQYEKNGKFYISYVEQVGEEEFKQIEKEVTKKYFKDNEEKVTQHYSNLTVPGGVNYTENAIQTPGILNISEAHINEFSKGISNMLGWFRSDEQVGKKAILDEKDEAGEYLPFPRTISKEKGSKTRRVLEVQSPLFQEGRDKKDLITKDNIPDLTGVPVSMYPNNKVGDIINLTSENDIPGGNFEIINKYLDKDPLGFNPDEDIFEIKRVAETEKLTKNQFLQLLNKKGNWIQFFIQSVVQDSVKKGYEKVLFPTGDTAAKVEGHQTLANDIIRLKRDKETAIIKENFKEDALNIENIPHYFSVGKQEIIFYEDLNIWELSLNEEALEESINFADIDAKRLSKEEVIVFYKTSDEYLDIGLTERSSEEIQKEIDHIKETGIEKLKPIEAFYSNRVTNILNKLYDVKKVTDEHSNTWNEIDLTGTVKDQVDDIDFLMPTAGAKLGNTERVRINKIEKEAIRERHIAKEAASKGDIEAVKTSRARLEKLQESLNDPIQGANQRLRLAKKINSVKDILAYADKQLTEVDKLFMNSAMSFEDLQYSQRIVDLWLRAGDFTKKDNSHIFLDKYEYNTPEIQEKFNHYRSIASRLQGKITILQEKYFGDFVREHTSGNLSNEEIFAAMKDLSFIDSRFLALRRIDDPMVQAIFTAVEAANMRAQQEADVAWKELDELDKKFRKASSNNYEILKQLTKDGKETGRMVGRFSNEFYRVREGLADKAFNMVDNLGKPIKNRKDIDNYFNWINKNTITFDTRMLFEDQLTEDETMPAEFLYIGEAVKYSENQRNEHIAEIKEHLGEKGFEFYMARQEDKYNSFRLERNLKYEVIQSELSEFTQKERDAFFIEWLKENSPYWSMDMAENPKLRQRSDKSFYRPIGTSKFAIQIPRKSIGNKETEWYDRNYEKIENNEDLYAYHQFVVEMLNKMRYLLPDSKAKLLGVGILPTINKSIMDMFSEKGLMMGITPFFDKLKQLQSTKDVSTTNTSDTNPRTGKIKKEINIQFIEDTEAKVDALVRIAKIKHKQETGKPATNAEKKAFKAIARETLSKEKSWDVTRIMKAHILSVLAYKHKSVIAAEISAAESLLENRKEIVANKTGEQMQNTEEEDQSVPGGLKNLKASFEYFMDEVFYGIGGRKIQGVSKNKSYSKAEAITKKELEALLEKTEDEAEKELLQKQIKNLGAYKTLSDKGDLLLKAQTLKGLGWNIFSGFSNIGFGVISNLIEMSDGRTYTAAQMRKAYMLTTNSIGRNLTFNAFDGINGNAVKIRTMMDQWDLLQTTNKELFDMTNKSSVGALKRFGPFTIQERSEYLNYAPVMIAVMLNFKATDPDGNEITLWDAMGLDGKLKEGFTANDIDGKPFDEIKMVQKIKRVIEMNHGDYNNPLLIKATVGGRALSQFRTWMFEGFATRFESEKTDYALSYGMDKPYVRKGRYRSYTQGQLAVTGATIGTMFLPGIGTAIGGAIGFLGGKYTAAIKSKTEGNAVADILFTLKQLARKLMFQKTQFGDKFDKVDAANMRKNMTELYLMVTLAGVALLLKALMSDDDEEEDFITMFLLGQTSRLQTDIGFYTNPMEFEKITKSALPVAGLVEDVFGWFGDVANLFDDDEKNDTFQSGTFKGESKVWVHFAELLPGTAIGVRTLRVKDRVID